MALAPLCGFIIRIFGGRKSYDGCRESLGFDVAGRFLRRFRGGYLSKYTCFRKNVEIY